MNFLAHLWLADQAGAELAGAILGDVIRGHIKSTSRPSADDDARPATATDSRTNNPTDKPANEFPVSLARSILLHRRIDAATDRHPRVRAAAARFPPGARRYAGVLLDLIYDHLLASDWTRWHPQPLDDFAAHAARDVADAGPWFVRAGRTAPSAQRFQQLLLSYATKAGLEQAIDRTAMRLRKPQGLLDAAQGWSSHQQNLAADLPVLLDDLRQTAQHFMAAPAAAESAQN